MTETYSETLSDYDRKVLSDRAVLPFVANARGYSSAPSKGDIPTAFAPGQRNAPALIIPRWHPNGDVAEPLIRPKDPKPNKDGKIAKYMPPAGSVGALDVHRLSRPPSATRPRRCCSVSQS